MTSSTSSSSQSHIPTPAERRYIDEIHRQAHANIPDIPCNPLVEQFCRKVRGDDPRFQECLKDMEEARAQRAEQREREGGMTLGGGLGGGGMGGMASLLGGMGRGGGGGGRGAAAGGGAGGGGGRGDGPPEELKQMILEMEQRLANAFLEAKK